MLALLPVPLFIFEVLILAVLEVVDGRLDVNIVHSHELELVGLGGIVTHRTHECLLFSLEVELVLMLQCFLRLQLLLELGESLSFLRSRDLGLAPRF